MEGSCGLIGVQRLFPLSHARGRTRPPPRSAGCRRRRRVARLRRRSRQHQVLAARPDRRRATSASCNCRGAGSRPTASSAARLPGGGELWASSRVIFEQLDQGRSEALARRQPPFVQNFKATPLMVGGRLFLNTPSSIGAADRREDRRDALGLQPEELRSGHDDDERALEPARRRVLDRRQGRTGASGAPATAICSLSTRRPAQPVDELRRSTARVDLMQGLPQREARLARLAERADLFSAVAADRRARHGRSTPASISSYNIIKEQIPGWTRGWDVRTGKLKWTFHTVPRPGEFGNETWERRFVVLHREGERLDDLQRRRGARLRVPAAQHGGARLLRRPSARRRPVRRVAALPRRRDRQARLALPVRAPRPVGLRPAGRAEPARRHRERQARSRPSRRSRSRGSCSPSIA